MELPAQLVIFSFPSILYVIVNKRKGKEKRLIREELGLTSCENRFYAEALAVALIAGVLMLGALLVVHKSVLESPIVSTSRYRDVTPSVFSFITAWIREGLYVALGEEVLFRGLLGGWLVRRFGFKTGNLIQATVFLLPHLLLLFISSSFWLVVIVQFLAGWALGFLRTRSNSILPGWFAHSLMNALGAFSSMIG